MNKAIFLTAAFLVLSCSSQFNYTSTYFDYSGNDGCSPANIGHWLGGDLPEYSGNTLEGMRGIESMQSSRCFKNWEFDVNQTEDSLVLWHDSVHNNVPLLNTKAKDLPNAPGLSQFVDAFEDIDVVKPVVIDLKTEITALDWEELLRTARTIREKHEVPVWFLISPHLAKNSSQPCAFIAGEFDVLLYRRGGPLC